MKWNKSQINIIVSLNNMKPNPKNPRKNYNKQELEQLQYSLQALGQMNNCEIDEKGFILKGHRRHYAATELGWNTLKCNIVVGLTPFEKSARMVSDNVTQIQFNAWENRDSISRIYWDEFLEEYIPRSSNDKGYTTFAKQMGLSISYVKKIIESSKGENKKYLEVLKKEKVSANTVDEVLTAPKELRRYLVDVAIRRTKKDKGLSSDKRIRDYVRAAKRKAILETSDKRIDKRKFRVWIDRIESLGFEFGDHILEKGDIEHLKKLEISLRKHILGFYQKLSKKIKR